VCDFDDSRSTKRPYEVLIIGRMTMHSDDGDKCNVKQLPDHRVIVSVPCSIHSRKPPLRSQCCLVLFILLSIYIHTYAYIIVI